MKQWTHTGAMKYKDWSMPFGAFPLRWERLTHPLLSEPLKSSQNWINPSRGRVILRIRLDTEHLRDPICMLHCFFWLLYHIISPYLLFSNVEVECNWVVSLFLGFRAFLGVMSFYHLLFEAWEWSERHWGLAIETKSRDRNDSFHVWSTGS